jgi:hypothetical protein
VINQIDGSKKWHERYVAAEPFPHIVLEDFLAPRFAERIVAELNATDIEAWSRDDHPDQVNKRWMADPDRLPTTVGMALRYLNSPEACLFFSELTGIPDLQPDPGYLGGGVHVSLAGGRLGVHADFNLHPKLGLHRRVNALIFLNKDWDPAWNGQLELWARNLEYPVEVVNPDFNRLVAFTITDDAFHGVPQPIACPSDRKRFSLALYYYSAERPDAEKAPFHWASWQQIARE